MTTILDGKALSKKIELEIKEEREKLDFAPRLDVILVGNNSASKVYVGGKEKACKRIGLESHIHRLEKTTTNELLNLIEELNNDPNVDGILVQLPLPSNIDSEIVLRKILPEKDVDGFHPVNIGKLVLGEDGIRPCTPLGIIRLLEEYNVELLGKKVVVVGRSNIVGKPMSLMLLEKHATVTICHSKTSELCAEVKRADVIVAAVGRAKMITKEWVKDGAVVIDVGMNRDENEKLCGDVDFDSVKSVASMITPVPGGVGPLTIAMLMKNTLRAALMRRNV